MKRAAGISLVCLLLLTLSPGGIHGDELDQITDQIEETEEEMETKEAQLEELENQERQLRGSLNYYQYQVTVAEEQLLGLQQSITEQEQSIRRKKEEIDAQKEDLSQERGRLYNQIRILYKNSFTEPLEIYLQAADRLEGAQMAIYHQSVIESLQKRVNLLARRIDNLQEERAALEEELSGLQKDRRLLEEEKKVVERTIDQTRQQVKAARSEQQQLMQQLTGVKRRLQELTRKEQEILAKKAAAALASTTVGEIELSREAIVEAPPQDGNVYFSFWTYGYPHRVGMNQYGAYGRAKAGQNYQEILKTYYQGVKVEERSVPQEIKIKVKDKVRTIAFEDDYLLGIGEMPSCWGGEENGGLEALKAQAVAARTYALKYTNNGQSPICITQECQVYVGRSKIDKVCGNYWERAVRETEGQVLTYGGQLISAWYASTAGGFTLDVEDVWGSRVPYARGIKDIDGEGNFYEGCLKQSAGQSCKWADSPFYHKCWGDQPWLSRAEVEDLLNASLLPESYDAHLPSADNEGFSQQEVIETLEEEGVEPVQDLKSIEVIGVETESSLLLRIYHRGGYLDIDAQRFRFVYNLRSPGTDALWTSRFDIITN